MPMRLPPWSAAGAGKRNRAARPPRALRPVRRPDTGRTGGGLGRSSPPSRLVDAFDQVVEPLITEITCLRSHELRLFHLVSAYIDSPSGELRPRAAAPEACQLRPTLPSQA